MAAKVQQFPDIRAKEVTFYSKEFKNLGISLFCLLFLYHRPAFGDAAYACFWPGCARCLGERTISGHTIKPLITVVFRNVGGGKALDAFQI